MMNRRSFLQGAAAAAVALHTLPLAAKPKPASALRLTILHTNDTHSHIEPIEATEHAGLGGVVARAAMLQKLRAEHENLLLLDAGDFLQGTPYFNLFGGKVELQAMSQLGYDAGTIGNHEFDGGVGQLASMVQQHANFPILNCNYDFSDTPMKGVAREHLVIEKQGLRIGLLGLGIKLEGLVPMKHVGATRYLNPIENAQRVATHLREEEKCDYVIALSHLNLRSAAETEWTDMPGDRDLVREVPGIDLIIGGHNHWLLPHPESFFRSKERQMGYITQAGWAGTLLGMLQFDIFERDKKELAASRSLAVRQEA
jgi:5'-nucleotidase